MLKYFDRREMYIPLKVLCGVLCAAFIAPAVANVATTAGSNLTAYNGTGATNNNKWNSMMNARGGMAANVAEANLDNCEAIILRCATKKCSSGCGDASVARPIVAGCVNSNASCKKHGDAFIDSLTGQIVAKSTAKAQEQQNAVAIAQAQAEAQAAAATAAAEQSNAQMQQMQSQMAAMQQQMAESMAQMQSQMAAQSESQAAQIQSALEESRVSRAAAEEEPTIDGVELGTAEQIAAKNGINPDILVREQIGGQIETAVEDAVTSLKTLKQTLDSLLEYAGCDSSANNCTGPKRVKKFKDLANQFFDPYEAVVENMYDALILAMTVGIDVSDVIMLLSGSCNMWGKYMCDTCSSKQAGTCTDEGCCECYDKDNRSCFYRVKTANGKVAKDQPHCRLVSIINENEEVQREWIDANSGMTGSTQVACASDVVMNVSLFRGMKKTATVDIETLRNLVNQDAPQACKTKRGQQEKPDLADDCGAKFCMINMSESTERWKKLQNAVATKKLGKRKNYCFATESQMKNDRENIEREVTQTQACNLRKNQTDCLKKIGNTECTWSTIAGKCYSENENKKCSDYQTRTSCEQGSGCEWDSDTRSCTVLANICAGYFTADICRNNNKCAWLDKARECVEKGTESRYQNVYKPAEVRYSCEYYTYSELECIRHENEGCHWVEDETEFDGGHCESR